MFTVKEVRAFAAKREQDVLCAALVNLVEGEKNVGLVMDVDTKDLCHFFIIWLDEQRFFLDKFCEVLMRDIKNQFSAALMTKIKELVVEGWIHLRRKRAGDHQHIQVGGSTQQLKHLVLLGTNNRSTCIRELKLAFWCGHKNVYAGDAVNPHRLDRANLRRLFNNIIAREATKKAQDSGLSSVVSKRKRDVQTLTVWCVYGISCAVDVRIRRNSRVDVHVDCRISGKCVNHQSSL